MADEDGMILTFPGFVLDVDDTDGDALVPLSSVDSQAKVHYTNDGSLECAQHHAFAQQAAVKKFKACPVVTRSQTQASSSLRSSAVNMDAMSPAHDEFSPGPDAINENVPSKDSSPPDKPSVTDPHLIVPSHTRLESGIGGQL